jgi:hypothetical protein
MHLRLFAFALLLSGCSGLTTMPLGDRATMPGSDGARIAMAAPDKVPNVAGTYDGLYSETIGSTTVHGSVTITVQQSGSKISGEFDVVVNSHHFDFPIKGTVKSSPRGASLHFTIVNVSGGRNANAKALVSGKKLRGKAIVPPTGSKQGVLIKFKTKK